MNASGIITRDAKHKYIILNINSQKFEQQNGKIEYALYYIPINIILYKPI